MLRLGRRPATAVRRASLLLLAIGLLAAAAVAEEEEAVRVYSAVHPAVVGLENLEGNGTGILLDRTGLILTNAHVVASPLPFTCQIDVRHGTRLEAVTFKTVKIVGFHPKFDLALVRIDPKEHSGTLEPARLASRKAQPGQRVYAIGNPSGGGGVTLSKTITSGILSGVDRVIDDVAYYQISAPINPGNSGGPLTDKSGEVIGLVTLKFTDVENVGFAIPLHDLKTEEFVPLRQRKGDPEKARELLEMAEKYYERGVTLMQARGDEDPEGQVLHMVAAKLYHMALTYDPANDTIYYNVGMLLRRLDLHEIAAAYLVQAIELNPWGKDNTSDYYRELGLTLVKQKKPDDARTAWQEGVAKNPIKAAKIWEDLAIYWLHEKNDPYQAAYSAAVVIKLGDPRSRLDVMRRLYDEARGRLSDADRAKLGDAETKILATLERQEAAAQQRRQANARYLTSEFAALAAKASPLAGDETPQVVVRGERPVTPPPAEPVVAKPPPPKLDLTIPPGSIDLLSQINPRQDAVKGNWSFDGKTLVSPVVAGALLQLPQPPPAEYDLTLVLERKSNQREFVIGLVRAGVQNAFFLDEGGKASGLDTSARGAYQRQVLTNDKPVTVVLKVRNEGLLVTIDGERIFFERALGPFPPAPQPWRTPEPSRLFLGSQISKYVVHKLMLTPYRRP
jgi:tetratricopeptide (TPR) repeat protein